MTHEGLPTFKPQELCSTLFAAAEVPLSVPEEWLHLFWTITQNQLDRFDPKHLSSILYAAKTLAIQPPTKWQRAFWQQSQRQLNRFNAQDLSNTLLAASFLSLDVPKGWQADFWKGCQAQLSRSTTQALAGTIYAACVLDLQLPHEIKALFSSELPHLIEHTHMGLGSLFSARDYLKRQEVDLVFPEDTLARLRCAADTSDSRIQKKVGWALLSVLKEVHADSQVVLEEEHFIESSASAVDFFIAACGDKGLVIQVDGPSHFLNKGTRQQRINGTTAFQTRFLRKKGYQVLRLPYDLLNRHGVFDIDDTDSLVPAALAGYLTEQLTPYLTTAT